MKINLDAEQSGNAISAYAPGVIRIAEREFRQPCVITADAVHLDLLPASISEIDAEHCSALINLDIEIILLGSGAKQQFIDSSLMRSMAERGVALEIMDTGAACRSFNILLAESRSVAAALFMI